MVMQAAIEWREGDRSAETCPRCRSLVQTHFERRTVQMRGTRLHVPAVLVAVCDDCDHTVRIPRQSLAQLREVGSGK
jgi:hypothetical protein